MNVRVSALDLAARVSVLTALENAERRFLERERDLRAADRLAEAHGAHEYVKWCHRAWDAEYNDPQPKGPK